MLDRILVTGDFQDPNLVKVKMPGDRSLLNMYLWAEKHAGGDYRISNRYIFLRPEAATLFKLTQK